MAYSMAVRSKQRYGSNTRNFKSKEGYKKWLSYGHMNVPEFGKTPMSIKIRGKAHKVKHT